MTSQRQIEANRKNARAGGRPLGKVAGHTLEAQEARKLLIALVHQHLEPIVNVLIAKALEGDIAAIKELLDRGFGKPAQEVQMIGDTRTVVFLPLELMQKHSLPGQAEVLDGNTLPAPSQ